MHGRVDGGPHLDVDAGVEHQPQRRERRVGARRRAADARDRTVEPHRRLHVEPHPVDQRRAPPASRLGYAPDVCRPTPNPAARTSRAAATQRRLPGGLPAREHEPVEQPVPAREQGQHVRATGPGPARAGRGSRRCGSTCTATGSPAGTPSRRAWPGQSHDDSGVRPAMASSAVTRSGQPPPHGTAVRSIVLALLADVERADRAVVAHDPGPHLALVVALRARGVLARQVAVRRADRERRRHRHVRQPEPSTARAGPARGRRRASRAARPCTGAAPCRPCTWSAARPGARGPRTGRR